MLDLTSTEISDEGLKPIAALTSLRELDLNHTRLSDAA